MSTDDDKRQARLSLVAAVEGGMPFHEAFRLYGDPDESYEGFSIDEHGNKTDEHLYEENPEGEKRLARGAVQRAIEKRGYTPERAIKSYGIPGESYDDIVAASKKPPAAPSPFTLTPVDRDPSAQ